VYASPQNRCCGLLRAREKLLPELEYTPVRPYFRSFTASLLVALAAPATAAAPQAAGTASDQVTIEGGRIDGAALASGVDAYLGIPFAAPPVRDLRWRDPQPVAKWAGVLHADHFGPQCTQPQRGTLTNQYSGAEVTSEDCLFLNVWAKPGLKKAPVIVFIYGGGFFIGSSSMALYGGEAMSREGAVFVNFNYRVGPLGFLAHPALSAESPHNTSGDYGFLDQIAALKWVKANIAQFGGDPGNVTIVGQSAGSMSVLTLQASPLAKGLFQRAVGMSGALIGGPSAMPALAEAEQDGLKLQKLLKADGIAQLRELPADRIVLPRTPDGPKVGPVQDGYVLPEPIDRIFARSAQQDVPLLIGFTHDESFGGIGPVKDLADYRAKATARFGKAAGTFLQLYPATSDAEAHAAARAADRDATMAVSMDAWAEAQASHGRAPVFSYEFARSHTYAPGVTFPDLDPATAGAYHTSEVPFWLGTLDSFNRFRTTRAWTAADRAFSQTMMRALLAFARTGNPDAGSVHWPRYSSSDRALIELDTAAHVGAWPARNKLDFFRAATRTATAGGVVRD
jgi:para-nitrobenzyl esterase